MFKEPTRTLTDAQRQNWNLFEECGSCECWHRKDFDGDCRNDDERFWPDENDAFRSFAEMREEENPVCMHCEQPLSRHENGDFLTCPQYG